MSAEDWLPISGGSDDPLTEAMAATGEAVRRSDARRMAPVSEPVRRTLRPRTATLPTGSKVELATLCAFPWAPHAPAWPARRPSEDAQSGSAVHLGAELLSVDDSAELVMAALAEEYGLTPGQTDAVEAMIAHVREVLQSDVYAWRVAEVSYAWDALTGAGRRLGTNRDYATRRWSEFVGTVDLLFATDGRVTIRDWKTGPRARWHTARKTPQLRFLAVAVARTEGLDEVTLELVHVDQDGWYRDTCTLDAFELAEAEEELLELFRRITSGTVLAPAPGPHCTDLYCPLAAACPVAVEATAAIARAAGVEVLVPEIRSVEQALRARVALKLYDERRDLLQEAIDTFARSHPLPLGEGRYYGLYEADGSEKLELTPEAERVLERRLGHFAGVAIEKSSSKTAVGKAVRAMLGPKPARGAIGKTEEPIFEDLRAVGALKQGKPVSRVQEYKRAGEGTAAPRKRQLPAAAGEPGDHIDTEGAPL